jgi:hypothetical protein
VSNLSSFEAVWPPGTDYAEVAVVSALAAAAPRMRRGRGAQSIDCGSLRMMSAS